MIENRNFKLKTKNMLKNGCRIRDQMFDRKVIVDQFSQNILLKCDTVSIFKVEKTRNMNHCSVGSKFNASPVPLYH